MVSENIEFPAPHQPKILTLDIETSPNLAHVWRIFQENVGINQILEATEVLCFAAKWYGEKKVHYFSQFKDGRDGMVNAAHELLNEADVVVHYNGKRFDVPHLNREFLLAGKTPPAPFRQVDLLQIVRQRFKFPSNKLDYVAQQLDVGQKLHDKVDHGLWIGCLNNDPKAWRIMERYNKQDVVLTEKVLDRLKPWLGNIFHYGVYTEEEFCCPICGSDNVQRRGYYSTGSLSYQRYACQEPDCGSWSRGSTAVIRTKLRAVV